MTATFNFFYFLEREGTNFSNVRNSPFLPDPGAKTVLRTKAFFFFRVGGQERRSLHMWAIGSSRQCEKDDGLKSGKVSLVSRVRHEVSCQEENEQLKVEFGNWTSTITITNFDDIPTVTAAENKTADLCPTARGGVGMPEVSFCVSACLNSRVILPKADTVSALPSQ